MSKMDAFKAEKWADQVSTIWCVVGGLLSAGVLALGVSAMLAGWIGLMVWAVSAVVGWLP
jgi:hypothetical protein